MDSLEWSKKFEVLSISRLLLESLGIPHDQVASLTDAEMDKLADRLQALYISQFSGQVRFFVRVYLAERNWHNATAQGGADATATE
jgi:hypothetical protein